LKPILPILLLFYASLNQLFSQRDQFIDPIFSTTQLKADLADLKSNLEAKHPNLYLYNPKSVIDQVFDSLGRGIVKPMTGLEFYAHITSISSIIKDGHTIILPSAATTALHNKNSKFLPFQLVMENNRLWIDMIFTKNTPIPEGAEILSINDVKAEEIIKQLLDRQVRDGNNLSYPTWILNHYFREYYSYVLGHPNQVNVQYKNNTIEQTATLSCLSKDSINFLRQLKYPNRVPQKKAKEGLTLKFAPDNQYAILTIKDFHKVVLQKEYQQHFYKVMDNYFKALSLKKTGNLILDLRDNQGGELLYGAYLLSYLMTNPFTVLDTYYTIDPSKSDHSLRQSNGTALGVHLPKDLAFSGAIFVLINGGSFSNSGIVAACLKRNQRAKFIGEETGGSSKILAGYAKYHTLKNTGIQVQIPTKQFMLNEAMPLSGRGVFPDYPVATNVGDDDAVLQYAISLITQKH
jgi:hypothetical protein